MHRRIPPRAGSGTLDLETPITELNFADWKGYFELELAESKA